MSTHLRKPEPFRLLVTETIGGMWRGTCPRHGLILVPKRFLCEDGTVICSRCKSEAKEWGK